MGAAKVRKKNGTYPTPEQIAAMEVGRRKQTTLWFPTAPDLSLAHIPEDARPQLRKRLEPWLAKLTHMGGKTQRVGIKGGDCYRVAQALVLTANDPSVKYIEGVWGRGGAAHGWATVDGYRVDLVGEFLYWRDGDNERLYEPYQAFSAEELRAALEENGYDDNTILHYEREGDAVSFSIVHQRWLDDGNSIDVHTCHDFNGPRNFCECQDRSVMCQQWEFCGCETDHIMAPALARLRQRIEAERAAAA
jgi:hypothetical protein